MKKTVVGKGEMEVVSGVVGVMTMVKSAGVGSLISVAFWKDRVRVNRLEVEERTKTGVQAAEWIAKERRRVECHENGRRLHIRNANDLIRLVGEIGRGRNRSWETKRNQAGQTMTG